MTAHPDMDRLAHQLEQALLPTYGDGIRATNLIPLPGGASRQTLQFDIEQPDRSRTELILRRDFPGRPSAPGNMGLEARILQAARGAGLAVPEVITSCDGPECWGTAGMVMKRVAGETIARRILRDDEFAAARQLLTAQCAEFLAGLHQLDPAPVEGLKSIDALGTCFKTYDDLGMTSPTFDFAFRWLEAHKPPPPSAPVIVHGDFRLGNLLVDRAGLTAVLDWEGVHLGDPVEDLGWLCVKAWRFGARNPVAGVGSYQTLLGAYNKAGGSPVDDNAFFWWQVFGTLRWGVICMSQTSTHLSGAMRSVELAAIGRRVCEQEWDLLTMLAPTALDHLALDPTHELAPIDHDLHGAPSLDELLVSVQEFLEAELVPATRGQTQFLTRVAANVLAMSVREVTLGPQQQVPHAERLARLGATSTAQVAHDVRHGRYDDREEELVNFLAETVRDKLQVANPGYLAGLPEMMGTRLPQK